MRIRDAFALRTHLPTPACQWLGFLAGGLFALFGSCLNAPAHAQPGEDLRPVDGSFRTQPERQAAQPELLPAAVTTVEFAPEPLYVSEYGLKFRVPIDWTTQRVQQRAAAARTIDPEFTRQDHLELKWTYLAADESNVTELAAPDNSMVIRIQTPRPAEGEPTLDVLAQSLGQKIVDSVSARNGAPAEAYVIFDKDPNLAISGRPAYRFYMRVPRGTDEPTGLVLAYTLIDLPGPHFLVLELVTPEENYLAARPVYETVVAATEFLDPRAADAQRWPLMLAASRFIAQASTADYQNAMTRVDGRMERLYAPGGTGADADDREVGVRRILCWPGRRGEIDPDKPASAFNESEQEEGYIVFVGGRYFDSAEDPVTHERRRVIADFAATYWMSTDRQREAWLKRMLIQTPLYPRPVPFTEMGARSGESLTVWTKAPGEPEVSVHPVFEGQGYLSQVEFLLFADMLAAAGIPTDFGYYAWQTDAATCRFIHDSVIPESSGPGWTIQRSFGDAVETHDIAFDGELRWRGTRREIGEAVVNCEPTDADRLTALWNAKGLPMTEIRDPGPARRR